MKKTEPLDQLEPLERPRPYLRETTNGALKNTETGEVYYERTWPAEDPTYYYGYRGEHN